jgi:hypothetical protein
MGPAKATDVQARAAATKTAKREVRRVVPEKENWRKIENDFMVPPVQQISVINWSGNGSRGGKNRFTSLSPIACSQVKKGVWLHV